MFREIYEDIKKVFEKSWFIFLFKYTTLGKLLTQKDVPSGWKFFLAYNSSWWWNRLWFRLHFKNNLFGFEEILGVLNVLKKSEILTEENCNLVFNHALPLGLANALLSLQQTGILNQANFDIVAKHANYDDWDNVLSLLQQTGISCQSSRLG